MTLWADRDNTLHAGLSSMSICLAENCPSILFRRLMKPRDPSHPLRSSNELLEIIMSRQPLARSLFVLDTIGPRIQQIALGTLGGAKDCEIMLADVTLNDLANHRPPSCRVTHSWARHFCR